LGQARGIGKRSCFEEGNNYNTQGEPKGRIQGGVISKKRTKEKHKVTKILHRSLPRYRQLSLAPYNSPLRPHSAKQQKPFRNKKSLPSLRGGYFFFDEEEKMSDEAISTEKE